jgi:hypothetical protein
MLSCDIVLKPRLVIRLIVILVMGFIPPNIVTVGLTDIFLRGTLDIVLSPLYQT